MFWSRDCQVLNQVLETNPVLALICSFFFFNIYLFIIYFWLHQILVVAHGLFVVAWAPELAGSVVVALGLSSCGMQAQ